jgi:hypothetical protein
VVIFDLVVLGVLVNLPLEVSLRIGFVETTRIFESPDFRVLLVVTVAS